MLRGGGLASRAIVQGGDGDGDGGGSGGRGGRLCRLLNFEFLC